MAWIRRERIADATCVDTLAACGPTRKIAVNLELIVRLFLVKKYSFT